MKPKSVMWLAALLVAMAPAFASAEEPARQGGIAWTAPQVLASGPAFDPAPADPPLPSNEEPGATIPTPDGRPADQEIPPCQWRSVWFDGFESGLSNWSTSGLWNLEGAADACGMLVAPYPTGPNAAYYGEDGICTYKNRGANSGSLAMVLDASLDGAVDAELAFLSYEETECGGRCAWDRRAVEVSTDGGTTWTSLAEGDGEGRWAERRVGLGEYAGGPVRVRFRFDTVDGYANGHFGWLVDDVEILGCFPASEETLHVGNIEGFLTVDPAGQTILRGHVLVVDQVGSPLHGVAVTVTVWAPEGSPHSLTRQTRLGGSAVFHWGSTAGGTWRLCVDDLALGGYVYDPAANALTCMEWSER